MRFRTQKTLSIICEQIVLYIFSQNDSPYMVAPCIIYMPTLRPYIVPSIVNILNIRYTMILRTGGTHKIHLTAATYCIVSV